MKITHHPNPFRLTDRMALPAAATPAEALTREGLDPEQYVVECNGELLPPERALSYPIQPEDEVALIPVLRNPALKTIAMIGVQIGAAFLVPGLGNFIGGVLFTSLTTVAQNAIAGALLSIAGSLAVGGVASLLQKTPGGNNYGVLGPSTVGRSGIPIPKGYGTMRSGGNLVESWIDIQGNNGDRHDTDDGDDLIGRQYINGRVDFGWGPGDYTQILLNGQDINSYSDVAYFWRRGTNDQGAVTANDPGWIVKNRTTTGTTQNTEPTTDFNTINNNYPINKRISAGIEHNYAVIPGQRDDTEKLTVFVTFPQGVWRTDDSNMIKRAAVDYDVYYRPAGTGDAGWIHVPPTAGNDYTSSTHYYYNIRQTLLRQATVIDGLAPGRYDVKVVKNGSGAVHNPLDLFEHENNKWGEQLWIESVQETSYTALLYRNTVQLCFRIMATSQIAGSDLQFQADITYGLSPRLTLPPELAAYPGDTPAVVVWDMLNDPLYGGAWSDIDLPFFARWAALTHRQVDRGDGTTQRLAVFNGVHDTTKNIWQAISSVAVMGFANLQRIGRRVTGWLDAPDVPAMQFGMGNIIKDSYEKTYLNLDDRSVEVECTFADAADDYKQRNPLRIVSAAAESSTEALKKQPVNLFGCTDRVQAWYWAALHLNENTDVLRTHVWKTNAQAIRCRVGNVVKFQHDVPGYGWGGVVMPGSTASEILFDRDDQPWTSTDIWQLTVQQPALQTASVQIVGINGNKVTVSALDSNAQADRLLQGSIDVAITDVSGTLLTVESSTGLGSGAATVWGLDVMETRTVTAMQGNRATLATPLSAVPPDYAQAIYQSTVRKAILVRIKQIRKDPGHQRYTLTAIDYFDSTYDVPAPVGLAETPADRTLPSTSGGSGGAEARFLVSYSEGMQDVTKSTPGGYSYTESVPYYTVTDVSVAGGGTGYSLAHTKVTLGSGYDVIDGSSGTETKDTDEALTFTVDADGSITDVTGWSGKMWNAVPSAYATR